MAKLTSPIKIKGTIGGLTFFSLDNPGDTFIREKGKTGVNTKRFMTDPAFTNARNHGKEWGEASRYARVLCRLGERFFAHAKEVSFAGRANKLMFDVMQHDTLNVRGNRSIVNALHTTLGKEELVGFEGNRNRPLSEVLKTKCKIVNDQVSITLRDTSQQISWPENATHAHFATATALWNPETGYRFILFSKEEVVMHGQKIAITLNPVIPESNRQIPPNLAGELKIQFLFIGFASLTLKKYAFLHRKYNTATIIACNGITKKSKSTPMPDVKFFFSPPSGP